MGNLENYLDLWGRLIDKTKFEKLIIWRIHDSGLYGDSYLILIPEEKAQNPRDYLQKNYLIEQNGKDLKELIQNRNSSIQIFNGPLERENLSLENLRELILTGFVQIRTNKMPLYSKKQKDYPDSEKMDKR